MRAMDSQKRTAVRLRPKARSLAEPPARVAVFTAIDGTLLDARTFASGRVRSVVGRLGAAGIPVVPVTIMTLDEAAPIADELGLGPAMIVEAGGAIARRRGDAWEVEPCGPPAETLLDVVRTIEERSGANLLIYSALPESEAAQLSGRSGAMLHASTHRSFSEPFVIETGDPDAVSRAASAIGFSVRRGRRFLHLCRECDQGEAFVRLREELGCEVAIGVGGAAVDAEFLARTDLPILIPGPDGELDADLVAQLPHARIAAAPAPEGWVAAVEEAVRSLAAPRRRAGP